MPAGTPWCCVLYTGCFPLAAHRGQAVRACAAWPLYSGKLIIVQTAGLDRVACRRGRRRLAGACPASARCDAGGGAALIPALAKSTRPRPRRVGTRCPSRRDVRRPSAPPSPTAQRGWSAMQLGSELRFRKQTENAAAGALGGLGRHRSSAVLAGGARRVVGSRIGDHGPADRVDVMIHSAAMHPNVDRTSIKAHGCLSARYILTNSNDNQLIILSISGQFGTSVASFGTFR